MDDKQYQQYMEKWRPEPPGWATEDYWPRRLLHIRTMTSFERRGRGTYGQDEYPKYNVLSYTWGRWSQTETTDHTLPVQGTTWRIPAVDKEHFTVEEFQHVVQELGRDGIEWAWIDIACIDQEDDAVKMDEVGRQASIFNRASTAFVWLSRIPTGELTDSLHAMSDAASIYGSSPSTTRAERFLLNLDTIHHSVATLFQDPWFSSLWTLQELIMRTDAVVLSKEGEMVRKTKSRARVYLGSIIADCGDLTRMSRLGKELLCNQGKQLLPTGKDTVTFSDPQVPAALEGKIPLNTMELLADIEDRISYAGLRSGQPSSNPNVQYSAAKFRQTQYAEDRIYGIMQIYGIRVGQSIRPNDQPSLDSLIEEFGLAINAKSPVIGQLFVHADETKTGLSWCITEQSTVPDWMSLPEMVDITIMSKIAKDDSGTVVATGRCCNFQEFYDRNIPESPFVADLSLFFDYSVCQQLDVPLNFHNRLLWKRNGARLMKHFEPGCLLMLALGQYTISQEMNRVENCCLLLRRISSASSTTPKPVYSRLGICCWRNPLEVDLVDPSRNKEMYLESRRYFESVDKLFRGPLDIELL